MLQLVRNFFLVKIRLLFFPLPYGDENNLTLGEKCRNVSFKLRTSEVEYFPTSYWLTSHHPFISFFMTMKLLFTHC